MSKVVFKSGIKMAKTVKANDNHPALQGVDVGVDQDNHSTADLALSGHDHALDDDQNLSGAASKASDVMIEASKQVGDKYLARRLRVLAAKIKTISNATKVAMEGGDQASGGSQDEYSTSSLPESGKDSDLSGPPLDKNQMPGKLPVYDSVPASPAQSGPQPRTSTKQASKVACPPVAAKEEEKEETDEKTAGTGWPSMMPPTWLEAKGYQSGDWSAAVEKAKEKGILKEGKKPSNSEYGAVVSIMKNMAKKTPATASIWKTFQASLKKKSGLHGTGSWEVEPEAYGSTVDLRISTNLDDGSVYSNENVTFSLLKTSADGRKASVEINDNALYHETRRIMVTADSAKKLAERWMDMGERLAKANLE